MSDSTLENPVDAPESTRSDISDAASKPFVGRWHKLASETNWEKGRIILEWRNALIEAKAPSSQYSDEAWANRVGFVTCQHIGRLRRVFERFGDTYGEYPKLYWSHFWAAIDWDDAELWLEGASSSRWSISQMCRMRTESMQLPEGQSAQSVMESETQRIESETDDGFLESTSSSRMESEATEGAEDADDDFGGKSKERFQSGPLNEDPDFGDQGKEASTSIAATSASEDVALTEAFAAKNPFEGLGQLPMDIIESVDPLKLCILRYRANQWHGFSKQQMLDLIEAIKGFCD